ncbi:MAG: tyrosine-type recombinase/integrase [Ktedonobacterales bacterium]|nr:tyrosine-type recombinase/integrase [Ktedonobacterales bacterium]
MPRKTKPRDPPVDQLGLFPVWEAPVPAHPEPSPLAPLPSFDGTTSLAGLALPYRNFLLLSDHTAHTIDCFLSDLRLLARFLGSETPIRAVTRQQLVDWLLFLKWGSELHPAPKTVARRVTFLKNFFGWLASAGVLHDNLAQSLVFARPLPPLPDLLHEDELARLVAAAEADARCHLLVMLTLDGGLKKEELLALTPGQVDLNNPAAPTVLIRLGHNRPQRDRLVQMPPAFTAAYARYERFYNPQEVIFDCTDRNLTYILARATKHAGIARRVTLQLLRDAFAVRQLRAGTSPETLREKLGLSDEAWHESSVKYRKLAFPI